MGIHHQIESGDRVVSALVAGLAREFGSGAADGLAERFLDAEAVDFHWDARSRERWIGAYESLDEEDIELDRVAIMGLLGGAWFVAICIVDGEGQPHAMSGCRTFGRRLDAEIALSTAR
ncbi:hypothetical protein [Sphingomonas oryzagri]